MERFLFFLSFIFFLASLCGGVLLLAFIVFNLEIHVIVKMFTFLFGLAGIFTLFSYIQDKLLS